MGHRWAAVLLASAILGAGPSEPPAGDPLPLVERLGATDAAARRAAADALIASGDRRLLAPVVDQLFFTAPRLREQCLRVLAALSGEPLPRRYMEWVEYVSGRDDLAALPGYLGWKGKLLAHIDRRFAALLREGVPVRLRAAEIVSGGVRFDGIPSLDQPPHVAAAEATYLQEGETVFAARLKSEARAWPVRILSWHEMLNDRLGGEPVTLSYCTLCRSAQLFRGRLPGGEETTFGTSGLLYRSNKLMFDRRTLTLWSNLTGEPMLGPLAADPRPLETLPLTTTTWGDWRRRHPDTTVLDLQPELGRRYGYDYVPGAADARRAGVAFPVQRRDARLPEREEVYGLRVGAHVKAYPMATLLAAGVVDDAVGGEPVVLVAEATSGAVRAYRRGVHSLRLDAGGALRDERGREWEVGEEALRVNGGSESLERLPGVASYWFAWQAFYPGSEVWVAH